MDTLTILDRLVGFATVSRDPNRPLIDFISDFLAGHGIESEIVEADWYAHDSLPPVPLGRMSIAGWLIEDWMTRMQTR